MKLLSLVVLSTSALCCGTGCTLTRGSSIAVGAKRPATNPETVKIYLHPPAHYEELGLVSADGRNAFASAQNLMDHAMDRLRKEAAKLGANGVLLTGAGDEYGGSVSSGFGSATATRFGNTVNAFGTGMGASNSIVNKAVSGVAIWFTKE